jgi:hypothetical protein
VWRADVLPGFVGNVIVDLVHGAPQSRDLTFIERK